MTGYVGEFLTIFTISEFVYSLSIMISTGLIWLTKVLKVE